MQIPRDDVDGIHRRGRLRCGQKPGKLTPPITHGHGPFNEPLLRRPGNLLG
ncbi:hypothetical protein GCM10017674_80860 [Streptomyces gardneri]|nr:hypothetical protein GCM10017674_80860 [Streptomyces gardneri]